MYVCEIHFLFLYIMCGSKNNHSLVTATALAYTIIKKYLTLLKLQMFRIEIGALFLFYFYFELMHIRTYLC